MPEAVSWFEIHSPDVAAAQRWYAALFGWSVAPAEGMEYAFIDTGREVGGGITATDDAARVIVYVSVPDIQGTLDRAVAAGGSVVVPVTEIPEMVTFALLADPHGAVIGIVQDDTPGDQYVLLYETSDRVAELAPIHYPAHLERLREFRERGDLLAVGTLGDGLPTGSLATFRTREAAEEFVADDPFTLNGVAKSHRIEPWSRLY
jgi:predicted enzyme related to lactoylglutathione lyase/uncharacterized protein YciI